MKNLNDTVKMYKHLVRCFYFNHIRILINAIKLTAEFLFNLVIPFNDFFFSKLTIYFCQENE